MELPPGRHRLIYGLILSALCLPGAFYAADIVVDASQTNGLIRPLHGVNLGPLCYRGTVDLSDYHREIGVPLTRVHDVVWVNADAVDISSIFRDFQRDPAEPESYDFASTDDYLQAIVKVGSQIVYRLGESIEHTPRKYRVHPPRDPEKWSRICLGIVRHYNEGWAGGFKHGIRYWEIWNEPDVRPAMWTGSDEQYFQLYEVTAKAVKARFPNARVGGPALGGTGDFNGDEFKPSAFLTNFLSYCRSHHAPIDFLSWHRYTSNPWDLPRRAQAMRRVLDAHGFASTESHLNEWNYLPRDDWRPMLKEGQGVMRERWYEEMGGPAGAAFATCGLMLLQDGQLDAANYYTGEIQGFGLFNYHGVPKKTFYAFKGFKRLLDTPCRLVLTGEQPDRLAACAGITPDRSAIGILIGNLKSNDKTLKITVSHIPWDGPTHGELLMVDETHNLTTVRDLQSTSRMLELSEPMTTPAVYFLTLRKSGQ